MDRARELRVFVKKIVYSTDENDIETKCLGGGPRAVNKGIGKTRRAFFSSGAEVFCRGSSIQYIKQVHH